MSDRYYAQMVDYLKISPWELINAQHWPNSDEAKALEKKLMPKVTRKDLSKELAELLDTKENFAKVPMNSLVTIVAAIKSKRFREVQIPEGRLKAPYLKAIHEALKLDSEIDLSTATVAVMKELLEKINAKCSNPI